MDTVITYVLAKRAGQDPKENSFNVVLSKHEELDGTLNKMQYELDNHIKKIYLALHESIATYAATRSIVQ